MESRDEEKLTKGKKFSFSALIGLLILTCSSIYLESLQMNSSVINPIYDEKAKLLEINAFIENVTGICNQSIHNLYVLDSSEVGYFLNEQNHSEVYPANISLSTFNYNLSCAKISIALTALTDQPQKLVVTENTTDYMNSTNEKVLKLAQEFTIENSPSHITNFSVYLNFRCWWSLVYICLDIYRANEFATTFDQGQSVNTQPVKSPMPGDKLALTQDWINISYNNLLTPGDYIAVVYFDAVIPILIPENNSWQVHEYNNSIYDNGTSMFKNSTGHWNNITSHDIRDFLMKIEKSEYVNPQDINLKCYINNQGLNLTYYEDPDPGFLRFPWTSYADYYLPAKPTENIMFNFTSDITLYFGLAVRTMRYIKFLDAIGNFTVAQNKRRWTINYTSINSTTQLIPVFVFPLDWTVQTFYDRFGEPVIEYGVMYSTIYNKTYCGIYYPESGDGVKTFHYKGEFSSPNYLTGMNPQIFSGGNLTTQFSFFKGDKIRLQAIIQDSDSNPASGGNCTFYLYNPSGGLQLNYSINATNGIANSNNLSTSNFPIGSYTVMVTWTNGTEVGFDSFTFTISEKQVPIIPFSAPEPILLYILATIFAVLTAVIAGFIIRRKLQERNWEKSLLHLFVMTKDGRSVYNYPFGISEPDPTLISGMLTAMSSFVKETVGSKKQLKSIDQQDKKVILGHGEHCTVSVFGEKDLPIIHNKTEEFVKEFEKNYRAKLKDWDGSTTPFKGAGGIVEKYFPVSSEDKIIRGVGREILELKEKISSSTNPQEILSLLQNVTNLAETYKDIIREHWNKVYGQILKIANEKIQSSS